MSWKIVSRYNVNYKSDKKPLSCIFHFILVNDRSVVPFIAHSWKIRNLEQYVHIYPMLKEPLVIQ